MTPKLSLADYDVLRTLGSGSFGKVKHAKSRRDSKFYAIKIMCKADIMRLKQVDHINQERSILAQLSHPFIVNMMGNFRDDKYLYLVMECISGGELFTHLRRNKRFTEEQSKFYAAQIACVFDYIHSKNIVHRDLKPENILLCRDGYSKLTDFGFAKVIEPGARTFTLCGTPEYIAPEVLLNKGHGLAVDWWTLGILIYEMIIGQPPFCDEDPMGIYQKILAGKICFPKSMDINAKSLIKSLLTADLSRRFGNLKAGSRDVLTHEWFGSIDFNKLMERSLPAPFKPPMKDDKDVSNYSAVAESEPSVQAVAMAVDPFQEW